MPDTYKLQYDGMTLTYPVWNGYVSYEKFAPHFEYTTLWETTTPFKNMYSITLNDNIDNYDEFIVYGSAVRGTLHLDTQNHYVVNHNGVNQAGVNFAGRWEASNSFLLANGTDMWLNGTSGYITSSYYMGENTNSTAWTNALRNNDIMDLHPYKIVGIKEVE